MGQIGPEGTSEEGSFLGRISELSSITLEVTLEERLVPVNDEKVLDQVLQGQQSLPGIKSLLSPICELRVERISPNSPFHELFSPRNRRDLPPQRKLIFYSFNPGNIETKEGMFLVAIKEEKPIDKNFPWNIGWITDEEIVSLFPGA